MAVGEWDRRELCPDGSCTGLIGPEGTCKVCGRAAPNWGDERKRGTKEVVEDVDDDEDEDDEEEEEDEIAPTAPAEIGEWKKRQLCSDGACVGVIGDDGKCKVCGKPASGVVEDDEEDEDDDDEDGEEEAADDEDNDEDEDEDEDEEDDELAAAAADLAGVASHSEVASAKDLAASAATPKDDEDNRQLCPDGGCIGVIGPNGKCKVCGKAAA